MKLKDIAIIGGIILVGYIVYRVIKGEGIIGGTIQGIESATEGISQGIQSAGETIGLTGYTAGSVVPFATLWNLQSMLEGAPPIEEQLPTIPIETLQSVEQLTGLPVQEVIALATKEIESRETKRELKQVVEARSIAERLAYMKKLVTPS
jgi:hypothetical protein